MQNMNLILKYALIGILGIVIIVVLIEIYKVLRPVPDTGRQEFLNELCRIKPSDKRCK